MLETYYIRAKEGKTQIVTTILKKENYEEIKSRYDDEIIEKNTFKLKKDMPVIISKNDPLFFHRKGHIKDSCNIESNEKKEVEVVEAIAEGTGMCSNCFLE